MRPGCCLERQTNLRFTKTAAQVALRWLVQLENVSVIPKARSEQHQKENFEIFDFELTGEEMNTITQPGRKPVWH